MNLAFVFPGQGSQFVGMGRELMETFPIARETMEEASDALNFDLKKIILEGPEETLTLTQNTQPALLTLSIMALRSLLDQHKTSISDHAKFVAGHSLGEYSALCAAGVFSFSDALKLVRLRGQAMQKAVPVGKGAMAAILGLDFETIEKAVSEINLSDQQVEVANDNCPGQVVISGHKEAVEKANEALSALGAKRCIMLPVSAPFHSPLMEPAAQVMDEALAAINFEAPQLTPVMNVTASTLENSDRVRPLLVQQITGRVRWRESIQTMVNQGVTHFVEVGAGKVLSGLNRKIAPDCTVMNLSTPEDLDIFFKNHS
jgi:[acyl-carrier-protein] S-malonyltransferase